MLQISSLELAMFGIFETLLNLTQEGGPFIYVIWLGMFAGPAWILLSSIPLAFKIRVPAAVIMFPGFAMAWIGSYGTLQGLSMAQEYLSVVSEMTGPMAGSGTAIALHTETFGWAVAALLFVWAAFLMGVMGAIGAGKGSTLRWKHPLLVAVAGAGLSAGSFGLMLVHAPSWNSDPIAGGLYVSTLSVILGFALLGLILSTLRFHPEELRHQSRSLGNRCAIALCVFIAPILWLSSAAHVGESAGYSAMANAAPTMKLALMFASFAEASVWTGLIPWVCALMALAGLTAILPAIPYGKTFGSALGSALMTGLCLVTLALSWTSSSRAEQLLMSSSMRAGTLTALDSLDQPVVLSGIGDSRWSQKLCALRWDGEGWTGMRWPDQSEGTCAESWESVTLPLPYVPDPTLASTEEAAPTGQAPAREDRQIAENAGLLGALADRLDLRYGGGGEDPILKVGDQDCGVPLSSATMPQPHMRPQPFALAMEHDTPVRHVAETQWHEGGVEEITFIGSRPMGEDVSALPETILREHLLPLSWKLTWSNHPCTTHPQGSGISVLVQEHPDGARIERVTQGTRSAEVVVASPEEMFNMLERDPQFNPEESIHLVLVPGSEWTVNDLNRWCTRSWDGRFGATHNFCVLTDSDRAWQAESFTHSEWALQQAGTGAAAAMPSSQEGEDKPAKPPRQTIEDSPATPEAQGGAAMVVGSDPIILGALDRSLIDEVIKQHMNQIRYCYQSELGKDPALEGKIAVKFVISKDGTVSSAKKKTSTLNNAGVEQCVAGKFMQMQFPKPKGGGIVIVSYPFVFAPN